MPAMMSDPSHEDIPCRGEATTPNPQGEEEGRCERCGLSGAIEIAGRRFCLACYSDCGSCCLEFGADDLWALRNDI